jgi:hypothetical protein
MVIPREGFFYSCSRSYDSRTLEKDEKNDDEQSSFFFSFFLTRTSESFAEAKLLAKLVVQYLS